MSKKCYYSVRWLVKKCKNIFKYSINKKINSSYFIVFSDKETETKGTALYPREEKKVWLRKFTAFDDWKRRNSSARCNPHRRSATIMRQSTIAVVAGYHPEKNDSFHWRRANKFILNSNFPFLAADKLNLLKLNKYLSELNKHLFDLNKYLFQSNKYLSELNKHLFELNKYLLK